MVITLDKHKKPLGFCTERRARILIEKGRACVARYFPFTLIIKDKDVRELDDLPIYRIKIDPGSTATGIAVICNETDTMEFAMQIEHRGMEIHEAMLTRSSVRRNRRYRETRYRRPKWGRGQKKKGSKFTADCPRPEGWLPPSVKSVADNILSWVDKLCRWINITECSFEAVRFDTQLMDNPDISGEEYQHGTLFGLEVKEYLLDHCGHTCQYCGGESGDSRLEVEHVQPKAKGGTDKVGNLTIACHTCNQEKGSKDLHTWLAEQQAVSSNPTAGKKKRELAKARETGIQNVMNGKQTCVPDRHCAWANSIRRYIEKGLFGRFSNVECSTGGTTKKNREALGFPKVHHYDALCVGEAPPNGYTDHTNGYYLAAHAIGHGSRMRGHINKCGIITTKFNDRNKRCHGFQNGDIVAADIPEARGTKCIPYKNAGHHVGRITIRRGQSNCCITRFAGGQVNPNYKFVSLLQKGDGYEYDYRRVVSSQ